MPLKIIRPANTIFSHNEHSSVWLLVVYFFVHSSYCIKDTIICGHKKVFCRNEINGFKPTLKQPYLIYSKLTNWPFFIYKKFHRTQYIFTFPLRNTLFSTGKGYFTKFDNFCFRLSYPKKSNLIQCSNFHIPKQDHSVKSNFF